jgi:glucuronokinase
MVMVARQAGASAKFAGSGGAIVGTFEDEAQYDTLVKNLAKIGCRTFIPKIATKADEAASLVAGDTWRNS